MSELAIDDPGEVAVPHRFNDSAGRHAFPHAVVASVHRPGSNDYQLDREPEYSAPPRHFRVQPWPARWGFETERELEKKLNALPPFGDDSDLDRRVPAEYDHEETCRRPSSPTLLTISTGLFSVYTAG